MREIGNFFWFLLGGMVMGLAWWLVGILALFSVVGIPWARACFVIGWFALLPFGKVAIGREELTHRRDMGTGGLGAMGNIIWFVLAGFWLALGHVIAAIINCSTIIGIPFAIQHLKLAGIALAPIGKTIVSAEVAEAARKANAEAELAGLRDKV